MTVKQIAGSANDFQLVHHVTATGDQQAIGRLLAAQAAQVFGWRPQPVDPELNRARMAWFAEHWPQHHARIEGARALWAEEHGQASADGLTFDGLTGMAMGCSALWVPPSASTDGHGRIGRNYDFFTLTTSELMGLGEPQPGELPMAARPHVVTTVPDEGLASTVVSMSDLDGAMDGINEAGLAVALLMEDYAQTEPPTDSTPGIGVSSVQLLRYVLDTCEDTEQAKTALKGLPTYDFGMPLHYIMADAAGRAMVWENGSAFEVGDAALCVTNHPLHRHPDPRSLPEDSELTMTTFARLRSIFDASRGVTMSPESLRAALRGVQAGQDSPWRTTWNTVFDTHDRTMAVRFYLGDGEREPRYTEELLFTAGV
ncbi:MAG: linear amide C-N hydrolase [Thermoactinospora sp.]|nr:linear amide C-N hydrolase [Thermoactinospora sp.]